MPTKGKYRCPKCQTVYRPLDAGARRFICCGVPLERIAPEGFHGLAALGLNLERSPAVSTDAHSLGPRELEAVEIIPPRENSVDVLAIQTMLNTLVTDSLVSLEIAGDDNARHLIVRGTPEGIAHIRRQLQSTYDQISFRVLSPEQDPAHASSSPTASAQLTLTRPAYLPLKTYENGDFQEADPLRGLLGAFDGLEAGERALSQIILSPAPREWSRKYEGSTRQIEKNMNGEAMTMGSFLRQFVTAIALLPTLGFGLWALFSYMRQDWLTFLLSGVLFAGCIAGMMLLYQLFTGFASVDPNLVKEKIAAPAYDVNIRLFVAAKTAERADRKLREIAAAYRAVNLQSGNSFEAHRAEFDPRTLSLERASILSELTGHVMRLSTGELAALWHLPVGADLQQLERTLAKRILPLPRTVDEGILIGHSTHHGQHIPVHLATEALWRHIFMVAKTQKGKSTLMAHLAAEAMRKNIALVVIDPHGDLVRTLLGLVPTERAGDVIYLDFSDTHQVVGLNLLDVTQGRAPNEIVSNIVHVGNLIWTDNWGPRMEDALRMCLRPLLAMNEKLAREGKPQFTLIDIPALLELETFRLRLLREKVHAREVLQWWAGYYERLYDKMSVDVINPVLTKIHRFSGHTVVRNIVGQSSSTVNFREILDKRRILLINTATGLIGPDTGGLLGSVIVDYINFAVRQQMALADPDERVRVVVVVDEFQSIPGVDYPGLLAELEKFGASFILATQALGQLDAIGENLRASILANSDTLCVFQTSAEDADFLRHELDDAVSVTDVINLPDYTCYVKAERKSERLPVMHVETLPPAQSDAAVVQRIMGQMGRYTKPAAVVEAEREKFENEWYGQELEDLRNYLQAKERKAASDRARDRANNQKGARDSGVNNSAQNPGSSVPKADSPTDGSSAKGNARDDKGNQDNRQVKDNTGKDDQANGNKKDNGNGEGDKESGKDKRDPHANP